MKLTRLTIFRVQWSEDSGSTLTIARIELTIKKDFIDFAILDLLKNGRFMFIEIIGVKFKINF